MSRIKDPLSALTHFIGVLLSLVALIFLVQKSIHLNNGIYIVASLIFGVSLILLYSASTIYHSIKKPHLSGLLKKIDHMMIFVLIAGTYTPICIISLNGAIGYTILLIIWTCAMLGIIFKMFWVNAPRWICSTIYVAMGWLIIIAVFPLSKALSAYALLWLIFGGTIYTLGAVIYATKWPKFKNKWFGFHEVFHIFVLLGSVCHFILIFNFVL